MAPLRTGRVKLLRDDTFGVLVDDQTGLDHFFHRTAVLHGGFDGLTRGARVRFVPQHHPRGLRAVDVQPLTEAP